MLRSRNYPDPGQPEPPEVSVLIQVREAGRYRPRGEPQPWDRVAPGERIWVLYESDIVATAVVDRVAQLGDCSASDLRELAVGYPIHEAEEYWRSLSRSGPLGRFSAVVIWTRDVRWREAPLKRLVRFQTNRQRSKSWVVVNQAEDLAEVDAPPKVDAAPEVDATPRVAGERAASGQGESLANLILIAGILVLIGLAVLVVAYLFLNGHHDLIVRSGQAGSERDAAARGSRRYCRRTFPPR